MYIPKHWNVSKTYHINDIINIISNELLEYKNFDNGEFIDFLKKINSKLLNVVNK